MADCTQSSCHGVLRSCVRKHTELMSECTQSPCHTMHSCQIASAWHQPHVREHHEPSQGTYPQNECFNSFRIHAERIQSPWHHSLRIHDVLIRMKVHIQISPQSIWECDHSSLASKPDARRLQIEMHAGLWLQSQNASRSHVRMNSKSISQRPYHLGRMQWESNGIWFRCTPPANQNAFRKFVRMHSEAVSDAFRIHISTHSGCKSKCS